MTPIARLLGADHPLTGSRLRALPHPPPSWSTASSPPSRLGPPIAYGIAAANEPLIPMIDEQSVSDPRVGTAVPPVELVPVLDPIGVIRAKDREVIVAGSADGLVDAAAAGLIDGSELHPVQRITR